MSEGVYDAGCLRIDANSEVAVLGLGENLATHVGVKIPAVP